MNNKPWTSGPKEILEHGLGLLTSDDDTSRRLALLLIDNAVEVTIRTYLGLPERATGLQISFNKYTEVSASFPKLLNALEEHATDSLASIDLALIEWYHRLRNRLYHDGNGLTIERHLVVFYGQIAKVLWSRLFDEPEDEIRDVPATSPSEEEQQSRVQQFLYAWSEIENRLAWAAVHVHQADPHGPWVPNDALQTLADSGAISKEVVRDAKTLKALRNEIVHDRGATSITSDDLKSIQKLRARIDEIRRPGRRDDT